MLEFLVSWILEVISTLGYGGVFVLMTLESALIPIPSEVTMPFSGFLVTENRFNFWLIVAIGTLGNLVGSLIAYGLGFWGQEKVVRALIGKWGKFILLSEEELDRAEIWFRQFGDLIVFFSRILPAIRTFISLPAGIAKMNLYKFIFYTTAGSFIWSLFLTKIGVIWGKNWYRLEGIFQKFEIFLLFLGILLLVFYFRAKIGKAQKTI